MLAFLIHLELHWAENGVVDLNKPGKELEGMVLIPTKSVALRKSSNF